MEVRPILNKEARPNRSFFLLQNQVCFVRNIIHIGSIISRIGLDSTPDVTCGHGRRVQDQREDRDPPMVPLIWINGLRPATLNSLAAAFKELAG
ncbi:hypothetical protein VTK26DRAFT_2986 [Humicola hyalothermophila]